MAPVIRFVDVIRSLNEHDLTAQEMADAMLDETGFRSLEYAIQRLQEVANLCRQRFDN